MPRNYKRGSGKTGRKNNTADRHESKIRAAQRDKLILEWRLQGYTYDQIADAVAAAGYRKIQGRACKDVVDREITVHKAQLAGDVLTMELMRLDQLQLAITEDAMNGNLFAIDRFLSIMDRRAKMLGLDAPTKTEEVGKLAEAKTSLLNKLNAIGARLVAQTANAAPVIEAQAEPVPIAGPGKANDG
jgi:hypothetical protein